MKQTLWQQVGGEPVVGEVCRRLVASMRHDPMIGAFFRRTDLKRLAQLELQHAAAWMGGPTPYRGRALAAAHRRLQLRRGHFDRRLVLLTEAMQAAGVPSAQQRSWLAHQRRMEAEVVDKNC